MAQALATRPDEQKDAAARYDADEFAFSSNAIRLSLRQWLIVGGFALVLVIFAPWLWPQLEHFDPGPDYRLPYELLNDYWLYERYARVAATKCDVLLVGDSVVWGPYVDERHTLSHNLNALAGKVRFANMALNGAHPAALAGLMEYHGKAIRNKKVVLVCNLLWLSSTRRDLQEDKESEFNHPDLVPQFVPRIPSYKAETSKRLGRVIDRNVGFAGWTNHLQQAYFDSQSIPAWTLDHPLDNPLRQFTRKLPPGDNRIHDDARPWTKKHIRLANMPWIDPATSFQWQSFLRTVQVLRQRGNQVFVLVSPFNEYMLTPASRQRFQKVKQFVRRELEGKQIHLAMPPLLPSAEYADASHPLAAGYSRLARLLMRDPFFHN